MPGGHTIAAAGGRARCMCESSLLCGREPVLPRSAAGAAAAALLVLLLSAQMCPAAQCPQLSCQGRGWAFWGAAGGLCWGSFYPPSRRSRGVRLWCLMLRLGIWARIRKWEWPGVPDVSPFQLWAWLLQLKLQLLQQSLWSELCGSEALLFQRECICQQDEAGGSWPLGAGRSGRGPVQLQVGVKTNQPINQLNKHKTKQKQPFETAAG